MIKNINNIYVLNTIHNNMKKIAKVKKKNSDSNNITICILRKFNYFFFIIL